MNFTLGISVSFILNKTKIDKNGESIVQARVTLHGKRRKMKTGIKCKPEMWEGGRAKGRTKYAWELNANLARFSDNLIETAKDIEIKNPPLTYTKLKSAVYGERPVQSSLFQVYDEHLEKLAKLVEAGEMAPGSMERYSVVRKHLGAYAKRRYKTEDIYFEELDHRFVSDFELYLKTDAKPRISHNTVVRYMKFLRTVVLIAKKRDLLVKDPFLEYKISFREKDTVFLEEKELIKLIAKDFENERLNQVRDVFVFCCYTGLAYVDVEKVTMEHIQEDKHGKLWLVHRRQKSKVESTIPLFKAAVDIIERYKGRFDPGRQDRLLPVNSNQKYNAYLKEIADVCGISKKLTTHVARHTFATTVMLTNGASLEATAKMLGHKNLNTTRHYAKVVRDKLSREMDTVSENLRKSGLLE